MAIDIIITGVLGRMGREIAKIVLSDTQLRLAGCTEMPGHGAIGKSVGSFIGNEQIHVVISDSIRTLPVDSSVIIDFSSPASTCELLAAVRGRGAKIVIGTTGLSDAQLGIVRDSATDCAIVFSPNMSLGVNLLFYLTQIVSEKLGQQFDIEIIEAHHRMKKDSPSGTAKRLAEIAAAARQLSYESDVRHGREGIVGERTSNEIGMHAVRGGDIVGDHTVLFAGPGERIELRHMAHSRANFVQGAVTAAKWLSTKESGLFSMREVLGF